MLRTLVKLVAVIAASCAVCATAFVGALVVGYPMDAFLPRKYDRLANLAITFAAGVILPFSAWMGIVAYRFVMRWAGYL
jgi:hypothetical protein